MKFKGKPKCLARSKSSVCIHKFYLWTMICSHQVSTSTILLYCSLHFLNLLDSLWIIEMFTFGILMAIISARLWRVNNHKWFVCESVKHDDSLMFFVARSHLDKRRSILALLQSIPMKAIVATSAFLHRKEAYWQMQIQHVIEPEWPRSISSNSQTILKCGSRK